MSKRSERYKSYLSLFGEGKRNENIAWSLSSELQNDAQDIIDVQTQLEDNVMYWSENVNSAVTVETIERLTLQDYKSEVKLVDKNFKIMRVVDSVQQYIRNPNSALEYDDQVPIFKGSQFSKGEWAREFTSICNNNLLTKKAENEILNLIHNTWGHQTNLPITLTTVGRNRLKRNLIYGSKNNDTDGGDKDTSDDVSDNDDDDDSISNQNAASKAKKYVRKGSRWIDFPQCQNDCCVFVGKLTKVFSCPKCKAPRFRPCARSKCTGKGKIDCEHLLQDGIAYKSLHYRLLIPLITDLVNTKYFVTALHYRNKFQYTGHEDFYADILDGSVAKEHLDSMDKNYKAWCTEKAANSESTPINLLLGQFYDGGQLFKWRACNFWGLFTSILNLPPTYRGKLGISTFLSAIYAGKHTTVETFLFTDLYCEELRSLYEGFEYVGITGKRFFIQARLIFHCMDTKALEPVFKLKSMTTSRYGCPYCRSVHGQFNSWNAIYGGNRQFLPEDHYFRFFGQSGKCCPEGFYSPEGDWFLDEKFQSSDEPIMAVKLQRRKNWEFCEPCDKDPTRYNRIKSFLHDSNSVYAWHHTKDSGFDFQDISRDDTGIRKHIFFRHFDFRPQKEQRRITKAEYLDSACKARDLNLKRKRKELYDINGLTDVWPFERLPYADFSKNSTFPPEHAIEGVVKRCFEFVFGIYEEREPSKRQYKKKKIDNGSAKITAESVVKTAFVPIYRPSYHNRKKPYSCTTEEYNQCRACLQCTLIPVGVIDRSDWILDINLYKKFKISQWKIFISVYWNFILTILESVDQWYRKFFDCVGDKIRKLLSFNVAKSSVQQLQQEMNEMICWWECYFPESPPFQLHQVIELVSTIPLFGSQHAWSELFGEQCLGQVKALKKHSNSGGLSYERYMMNKCVDRELDTMERFYSKAVNETNQKAPNSTVKVTFDSDTNALSFKVIQFALYDPEGAKSTFYPEEINHFVKLCLSEVQKRYDQNENQCFKNSCFYRLVKSMRKHCNAAKESYYEMLIFVTDIRNSDLDLFPPEEVSLAKALLKFNPIFYRHAWIYGLQFRSRGSLFRMHANGDMGIDWKDKKNYSSWCKFQLTKSSSYGHLNAFFEVFIGDDSVDGLLVASVTSYKFARKAPNLVDIVYHKDNMDDSKVFIALQDIVPTRIATIPFGDNHLPIQISRKTIDNKKLVNDYRQQLCYTYMLQMDPDKISRMPEKRPCTLYLSSCTSEKKAKYSYALQSESSSSKTKLTFQIKKEDGQRYVVAKKVAQSEIVNHKPLQHQKQTLERNVVPNNKVARSEIVNHEAHQQQKQSLGTKEIVIKPKRMPSSSSRASGQIQFISTEAHTYDTTLGACSDKGCCSLCGKTTRECEPFYTGNNSSSSVSKNLLYSFPWRKNSCAIDSLGACLQMIYTNLSRSGKDIMEEYCPDLCVLFGKLSDGTVETFKAKELLESLLAIRIQKDPNPFLKISQHLFVSVEVAFQLYSIRLSNKIDDSVSLFTSTITVTNLCPQNCNSCVINTKQVFICDELWMHLRAKDESLLTLEKCMLLTIENPVVLCPNCGKRGKAQFSQFQGALVIRIRDYYLHVSENQLAESLPDEIKIGETIYRLCAGIYGDDTHFVSMVRDFSSNKVLICDGMSNNAQFIEPKPSIALFPAKFFEKSLNIAFFVRSEYL